MLNSTVAMRGLVSTMTSLNDQETAIAKKISSGLRISSLSEDAPASGLAVSMANTLAQDASFTSTAATVGNRMQAADTALGAVVSQLTSAITTATGALNGTMNDANRAAAAQTLSGIRQTLLSLGNSSYAGSYLFSGTGQDAPLVPDSSGAVSYQGTADGTSITCPDGSQVSTSLLASNVFLPAGGNVFSALQNIITVLVNPSSAGSPDAATLVGGLRSALDNVTRQRSSLNSSQSRVSGERDYVQQQATNLKAQQSALLSADTATLATQLSAVTTQRSALLSTIAAVQKGSLFDYL